MSAYVVSESHIDALVAFGLTSMIREHSPLSWYDEPARSDDAWPSGEHVRQLTHANTSKVWTMLLCENIRSVSYRYDDDDDLPGPIELDVTRGFRPTIGTLEPVAILKALDCYEYQACEHPEWLTSEARQFCESLRGFAIGCLPGYAEAAWEVNA